MEEKLQSGLKHRIKHLSPVLDPEHVPCHRRHRHRLQRVYKVMVLILSIVTLSIYCYYYYSYVHAARPSKVTPPRLIVNQYDHIEAADAVGDHAPDSAQKDSDHDYRYDFDRENYFEYEYEYQFQQNYYRQRYGYYHEYSDNGIVHEEYSEYNDTMLYSFQIVILLFLFVICFTSFQVFAFDEVPTKHE